MRMIDADALKVYFVDLSKEKDIGFGDVGRMITVKIEHIIDTIENAPTIEPKRGEWIRSSDIDIAWGSKVYTCSNCGHKRDSETNFCPNCGARMKGADDE